MTPPVPTADAVVPASFADLNIPPRLIEVLAGRGITAPFPIQSATLPDSLAGRDLLGRGRTGSGKTVAFSLPVACRLALSDSERQPRRPRGLILVPTRELAVQVADTLVPLCRARGQRVVLVYGGVSQQPQVSALHKGVDVVVATPGRLEDLIDQGHCRLDAVEITVLDEADHLADLGFLPAVRRLLDQTPQRSQRLLFSATLDNDVDALVRRYLNNPVTHAVDSATSEVPAMAHHVFEVSSGDKAAVIRELASGEGRALLFTRTKYGAKKLATQLTRSGIPSVELHGNLSQAARSRNLAAFSDGRARVLVATDIAARGIHVDDIGLVVHVDPPAEHKAYLHRSGRTARAGADGVVVTVMLPNQRRDVKQLTRAAGINPVMTVVAPGNPLVRELVGPEAARVTTPIVLDEPKPSSRPRPSSRSRGPRSADGARQRGPRQGERRRSDDNGTDAGSSHRRPRTSGRPDERPRREDSRPVREGSRPVREGSRPAREGERSRRDDGRPQRREGSENGTRRGAAPAPGRRRPSGPSGGKGGAPSSRRPRTGGGSAQPRGRR
jgi:superfamily II DNA/RNA helicase